MNRAKDNVMDSVEEVKNAIRAELKELRENKVKANHASAISHLAGQFFTGVKVQLTYIKMRQAAEVKPVKQLRGRK